jgi:nucleotide-binding universal stress UspA family protein
MANPVVRRILVPVELAATSQPDCAYAIELAAQLRAELLLLAVIDAPTTVALIGRHRAMAGGGRDFEQNLLQEVRSMLQQVVDTAARSGVRARGHVTVSEEVEEQILKEALVQQVDLILVRSRGQTGIMKALLGNTAGQILEAAPCPVLVARV